MLQLLKTTESSLKTIDDLASCNDKLECMDLADWDNKLGLLATVKSIADQRVFTIPLSDLEICPTKEYQLIDDYSMWFVNYGSEC